MMCTCNQFAHTSDRKEFCRRLAVELVVYRAISSVACNFSLNIEREEEKEGRIAGEKKAFELNRIKEQRNPQRENE